MLERVEAQLDMKPSRLVGDTNYGTAAMLGWLVEDKRIAPHIPVWDKAESNEGRFGRSDFTWEPGADRYVCPGGKTLERYRRGFKRKCSGIGKDNTMYYRASKLDCDPCPLKPRCCPNVPACKVPRSVHENARDLARELANTDA